ncbi:hypothetical protein Y032_0333g2803 [Ancylostoma ceylanicum]|uniref:Uncharacterized protein n=1 Tax=Ancylostoma ceylanicum TaxID=53326 RepID=A0A016RYW8_9BILA|nr:hypothetical protein Y032_0333g2803 [Ancylostoma ceylanicum]
MHAPGTAADGDGLPIRGVGKLSRLRSLPHMWRRDVRAHDLTAMTLYYGPYNIILTSAYHLQHKTGQPALPHEVHYGF